MAYPRGDGDGDGDGDGGPDPLTLQKYDPKDLSKIAIKVVNKGAPQRFREVEGCGRKNVFPTTAPDTPLLDSWIRL